jgi:hypothetical protein
VEAIEWIYVAGIRYSKKDNKNSNPTKKYEVS